MAVENGHVSMNTIVIAEQQSPTFIRIELPFPGWIPLYGSDNVPYLLPEGESWEKKFRVVKPDGLNVKCPVDRMPANTIFVLRTADNVDGDDSFLPEKTVVKAIKMFKNYIWVQKPKRGWLKVQNIHEPELNALQKDDPSIKMEKYMIVDEKSEKPRMDKFKAEQDEEYSKVIKEHQDKVNEWEKANANVEDDKKDELERPVLSLPPAKQVFPRYFRVTQKV